MFRLDFQVLFDSIKSINIATIFIDINKSNRFGNSDNSDSSYIIISDMNSIQIKFQLKYIFIYSLAEQPQNGFTKQADYTSEAAAVQFGVVPFHCDVVHVQFL